MDRPIKLALIGAKGAGKTTLAAGYAAVRPNVGGKDVISRNFLENQFKSWDNGKWPDPTNDRNKIEFRIGRDGRDDGIFSFNEYKGEYFSGERDARFLEKIVKKPDAALILVNPGMSDFTDSQKRAGLETDTKKVIDYLVGLAKNPDDRPVLALVWTACDKDSAESNEFKSFKKQLRDYVGDRLPCREFPVTLFGPLKDQLVPPGRPNDPSKNTAPAPFEWALEIVETRRRATRRNKALRRTLQGIGVILLATLAGFGLRSGCSRFAEDARLRSLQARFDRFEKAPTDNADPQSLKNWKKDWATATNCATDRTSAHLRELGRQFESSRPDWQCRHLEKESEDIVDNLNRVKFKFPLPQPIVANFQKWYRQAKRREESRLHDYPTIHESDFKPIRDKLSIARQASMERFKNALSPKDAIEGILIEDVWQPILDPNEYEAFKKSIQAPVIDVMTNEAEIAIASLKSKRGDPAKVLHDCKSWCDKNQSNPDMEQVVATAITLVGDWLESFSERSRRMPSPEGAIRKKEAEAFNAEFDKFRWLCKEAQVVFWNGYATRWPIALGRDCAGQSWFTDAMKPSDAFPQTFTLSKVEVVWRVDWSAWNSLHANFDGFRISFDVYKRGRETDTKVIVGPGKSSKAEDCQLKKKEAEKKSLPMTVPIWKTPTSKSVGLGEEMYVSLNVHDSLSGFTCWTRDSDLPLEFMFKTTQNGFLQGLQSGGFVETKKMFHFKDHSGDKANLAFRFHVSLEGRSLESMIKEYKDRDGAP